MSFDSPEVTAQFTQDEADFNIARAGWNQQLDQIYETTGEPRKEAMFKAQTTLDEMDEALLSMDGEIKKVTSSIATKARTRVREYRVFAGKSRAKFEELERKIEREQLYGQRAYRDDPTADAGHEQRQQLLRGTDRLDASSQRLKRTEALANETLGTGASIMASLHTQRATLEHTGEILQESEGYVDRSVKTLRGMSRRMATNRIITIAIITVLVLLIMAVIYSKFK